MLHPHFLPWIVFALVALVTPSSATTTTFKAGDPGLQFSAGWTNSTFNGVPFVNLNGEGNITARLPVGVTQVQYTGFKLPILSLYHVCLDGICSTINVTDSTANFPPPSVLFTLSVDPTSPHTLAIVNGLSTSTITFISLVVTTSDSNTTSTSSSASSVATATASASPTSTNGNQQNNSEGGPGNRALSTTIILLVLLGSISILVGLVVFLQRVRQRRLELIRNGGDDRTGNQKADPPNPSSAPPEVSMPSINRLSTFIASNTSQSRFENGLNSSSRYKSLPPAPAPSRPPTLGQPSTSRVAQLNEVGRPPHPGHPTLFLPSFLDFEEPSVSHFSTSATDHS
ncbi:hypothetical protein PLEOSDRAFT_155271 [Pleurotus ostreatus PC15]|uniref:Mid2 domain-containing protein n=2 Tax=Pleurotus TaxID=5320 RepID=A0A067NRN4_PLEO1|nr:hypothetical protein CCMSSC00406_0000313 [Pleurotus cornucopiae]KDQ30594.1 hypothetical protein PLEOSDRAFT_155271 [Pleurotus ostreatus PC15]